MGRSPFDRRGVLSRGRRALLQRLLAAAGLALVLVGLVGASLSAFGRAAAPSLRDSSSRAEAHSAAQSLGAARPLAAARPAQGVGPLNVLLYSDIVRWQSVAGDTVTITLLTDGEARARGSTIADPAGRVVVYLTTQVPRADVVVRPGDSLRVESSVGATITRTVPAFIVSLSQDETSVNVIGPPEASILYSFYAADGELLAVEFGQLGADGTGTGAVPGPIDVGAYGDVALTTDLGDLFIARWDLPFVGIQLGSETIFGTGTLGSDVIAELESVDGRWSAEPVEIVERPEWTTSFRDRDGRHRVRAGDVVTVSIGSLVLSGTVPSVLAHTDSSTELVAGLAPAHSELLISVEADGTLYEQTVQADASGRFTADFAGVTDIRPSTRVFATLFEGRMSYWALAVDRLVRAQLHGAWVVGGAAPYVRVTATLSSATDDLIASGESEAGPSGAYQVRLMGEAGPTETLPGQRLELQLEDGEPVQIVYPSLAVTIDVATNRITGRTLPNSQVDVLAQHVGDQAVVTATTTASGDFSADLDGILDLTAGVMGSVEVGLGSGASVFRHWAVPLVELDLGSPQVRVSGLPGAAFTVTVSRGEAEVGAAAGSLIGQGGTPSPAIASGETTITDSLGRPVGVAPGDTLTVTVGDQVTAFAVPAIDIELDPDSDLVSGTTAPSATVRVRITSHSGTFIAEAPSDADGRFVLDLAGQYDLAAGDRVDMTVTLAEGHRVSTTRSLHGLLVLLDTGVVLGTAAPSSTVRVQLRDEGGAERADVIVEAGADAAYTLVLTTDDGEVVLPSAGDTLIVEFEDVVLGMLIPRLTAHVDAESDAVYGTADPGRIDVRARSRGLERTLSVEADPWGAYRASFDGILDLVPGAEIEVRHRNADGFVAGVDRTVAALDVQNGGNKVLGAIDPSRPFTIDVVRAGVVVATTSGVSSSQGGRFEARIEDQEGDPLVLQTGDTVTVRWRADGDREAETSVLPITARLDPSTSVLRGQTVPSTTVTAQISYALPGWETTVSDHTGAYTISFNSELGPSLPGTFVQASVADTQGFTSFAVSVVPYLEAILGTGRVQGRASPFAQVGLSLVEDGIVRAGSFVRSDTDGLFTATLSASLETGQMLVLADPIQGITELVLPELEAHVDTGAERAWGRAPANSTISVRLLTPDRGTVRLSVDVDAGGDWELRNEDIDTPGVSLGNLLALEAWLDVNGHQVIAEAPEPARPTPGPTPTATPTSGPASVTPPGGTGTPGTSTPGTGTPAGETPGTGTGTPPRETPPNGTPASPTATGTAPTASPHLFRILAPWVASSRIG